MAAPEEPAPPHAALLRDWRCIWDSELAALAVDRELIEFLAHLAPALAPAAPPPPCAGTTSRATPCHRPLPPSARRGSRR